jgi:hypothetical protein
MSVFLPAEQNEDKPSVLHSTSARGAGSAVCRKLHQCRRRTGRGPHRASRGRIPFLVVDVEAVAGPSHIDLCDHHSVVRDGSRRGGRVTIAATSHSLKLSVCKFIRQWNVRWNYLAMKDLAVCAIVPMSSRRT